MEPLNYNNSNNNYYNRRDPDNYKTAVVATIIFIIMYIIIFLNLIWLGNFGSWLSGGPRVTVPALTSFAQNASASFIFSILPFIISLIFSYKVGMRRLFKTDIIIFVVHMILMFM